MSLITYIKRNIYTTFVIVQLLFLLLQICVFYPCIVSAPQDWYNQAMHPIDTVVNREQPQPMKIDSLIYKPTWDSLETRPLPVWFDQAKIGIFVQWGVFSVPSYVDSGSKGLSEWFWFYWRHEEDYVEPLDKTARRHLKDFLKKSESASKSVKEYVTKTYPPGWHYTDFASQFTAEFFDPDQWAEVFKRSGARYVVLTSKHHDGFTLWGSKQSWNWNSVDTGPHRDLVGDLGTAIRKAGLRYGLYHSLYEWFNPLYSEDKKNDFQTQDYIEEKLMPELKHIVRTYHPDILWSDGHMEAPCSYWNCTDFLAWLYNSSPVKDLVVTNDRWGSDVYCQHGSFLTCEDRYTPSDRQARKWEGRVAVDRESYGYRRNAQLLDYQDMDSLLEVLAQTISNGGNLLINIGPTSDGRIPPITEERLRQLGTWLNVNGDAVYNTTAWHTSQDRLNKDVYYTKRRTPTGIIIYCIILEWPKDDRLPLGSPKIGENTHVTWLGYQSNYEITFENIPAGIVLVLPKVSLADIPCKWAWVLAFHGLINENE